MGEKPTSKKQTVDPEVIISRHNACGRTSLFERERERRTGLPGWVVAEGSLTLMDTKDVSGNSSGGAMDRGKLSGERGAWLTLGKFTDWSLFSH